MGREDWKMKKGEDYCGMSQEELIQRMAQVMAQSIGKLLQPCIEQRCKQFLTIIHDELMTKEKV